MIGFHFDDTEWDKEEDCFKEESLYDTDGKTFERPNHDKVWVYSGKTGWSMENKQEERKMHIAQYFNNNGEVCETNTAWQEEMRTNMSNQHRSDGAKSFKKKKVKNKMAKKSRRNNR